MRCAAFVERNASSVKAGTSRRSSVALAADVAAALPRPRAVTESARLAVIAAAVQEAERALPPQVAGALVRLGRVQWALSSVTSNLAPDEQVGRLAAIAEALADITAPSPQEGTGAPAPGGELLGQVVERALGALEPAPDGWPLARLLEAVPGDRPALARTVVGPAAQLVGRLSPDWRRPRAVIELARLTAIASPADAPAWFRTALDDVLTLLQSSRTLEQERLVRYWAAVDVQAVVEQLPRLAFRGDAYSVRALVALGAAGRPIDPRMLRSLLDQAEQQLVPIAPSPWHAALAWAEIGRGRHLDGDGPAALAALAACRQAGAAVGGDDDPERHMQGRTRMANDTLIAAAELAADLGDAAAPELLERSWKAVATDGAFDGLPQLVALQHRLQPDLLELALKRLTQPELRVKARQHALDRMLSTHPGPDELSTAFGWLLDLVDENEAALLPAGVSTLAHAAASAAPATETGREAAMSLAIPRLDPAAVVDVRVTHLSRLDPADPAYADWLRETVLGWWKHERNPNFLARLPAALLTIPDNHLIRLASQAPSATDTLHSVLLHGVLAFRLSLEAPGDRWRLSRRHIAALRSG